MQSPAPVQLFAEEMEMLQGRNHAGITGGRYDEDKLSSANGNQMNFTPNKMKRILNLYPPYLGAGVKVTYISADWRELHVSLSRRWYNRNAVGTHFGGSLYSMVDPHIMLLLMRLLGRDYRVWDTAAGIEFIRASKKQVSAVIKLSDEDLEQIRRHTAAGEKYFADFDIDITDAAGSLVAKVHKTIYVRRKGMNCSSQ